MGILQKNQKQEIRFKKGDFVIYELNDVQREDLTNMIKESNTIQVTETEVKGDIGSQITKHILRTYTSLGAEIDDYTDAELGVLLDEGNRTVKLFMKAIKEMVEEIVEDILDEYYQNVKDNNQLMTAMGKEIDANKMIERMLKIFKKQGVNLTKEELIENINNPEKLNEIILSKKKINKKKK